jgi:hypothetical protein
MIVPFAWELKITGFKGTKRGVERKYFALLPVLKRWRYTHPRVGVVVYIWLVVCEL